MPNPVYTYRHHVMPLAQISLTLSLSFAIRPYHPSLPAGLPGHIMYQ